MDQPDSVSWDMAADVVIVGFGGAGACAAIEAARQGASVLILERYLGGGATALSGGVAYLGGGTGPQKQAGFDDTPEAMFDYLKQEVRGAVADETLRRLCEDSPATLRWLEEAGVPFEGSFCPFKTSYPTDEYYLYYSGNETADARNSHGEPAPRGHRAKGKGRSGRVFFGALRDAVNKSGAEVLHQTCAERLVADEAGRVIGVECRAMPRGTLASRCHGLLAKISHKTALYLPIVGKVASHLLSALEGRYGRPLSVRARKGVVLSGGGFIFNQDMLREIAPNYVGGLPLGTIGDDGSGIRLGVDVGGATGRMNRIGAWRFYVPPEAFLAGVLVDRQGRRICNEAMYGATVGRHMVEEHDGKAYLIVDAALWKRARSQLRKQTLLFHKLQALYLFLPGHWRARSLAKLASKAGIAAEALQQTIADYNQTAGGNGGTDPLGKPSKFHHPLTRPPFYALDCSLKNSRFFPCPILSLGGLVVDEGTGQVKRTDGSVIDGLYAAGRNAVGICSESYVSGLAITDCIFSGRRAGNHAATSPDA